jgi:DNA (cytosine-5)-methyltransferase 1
MTRARPKLLDLFCKAGGAAVGYHRAGFDVVGVDIEPQPNYPFEFVQGDALEVVGRIGAEFDAIHASPPCQRYSVGRSIHGSGDRHPDLVAPVREALSRAGRPWVIENVVGAPLSPYSAVLCGLMFGLGVLRHRRFEASFLLLAPPHQRHPKHLTTGTRTAKRGGRGNGYSTGEQGLVCVAGNNFVREAAAKAMGIDWMTRRELAQAIPPAYTAFVGTQLIALIHREAVA